MLCFIKNGKFRLRFFLLLFIIFFPSLSFSQGKIVFKEVLVTGIGQSQEEALNNAFAEAISSVNGKNVQTQTIIKIMGGEAIPKPKEKKQDKSLDPNVEYIGKTLENISRIFKNLPEKQNEITSEKKDEKPKTPEYTQSYIKKLVDETKGGIKSYEILENKKNEQGWIEIKVKAQVAAFEFPIEASRVRIAVFPFKVFNAQGDKEKLQRLVNQEINNYFVQTRKFAVLDRSYIEEIAKEKSKILDGSAPAIEMAKIGNEISADFIIVGSVEDFKTEKTVTKILTDESTKISRESAIINLNFRVVDVATKQISNSDSIKLKISSKGGPNEAMSDIAVKAARNLGEDVLFSVYPVLVEKIDGPDLYLGQGGKQFKSGDIYEIFEKGEKIFDSYTKESIGNVESPRGTVQIISVSNNFAKARPREKGVDFSNNFISGKYVVRPIKIDPKLAEEANFKENKEKIDNQRKERKKKIEDEM